MIIGKKDNKYFLNLVKELFNPTKITKIEHGSYKIGDLIIMKFNALMYTDPDIYYIFYQSNELSVSRRHIKKVYNKLEKYYNMDNNEIREQKLKRILKI